MKKIFATTMLIMALMLGSSVMNGSYSQPPTPPEVGGSSNNQMGGPTAPLEGGIAILIALATSYGIRKSRLTRDEKKEQN